MAQEIPSRLSSNPFSYQNFAERSMSKRVTSLPQKDVILNTRTESLEIKDNEIRKNVQNETANQQLIEQQEVQQDTNRNPTNLSFLFENGKLTNDAFNAIEEGGLEGLVSLTNEIAGSKLNLKSDNCDPRHKSKTSPVVFCLSSIMAIISLTIISDILYKVKSSPF